MYLYTSETTIINRDIINNNITVSSSIGATFKNLAVTGISAKNNCNKIEPSIIPMTNGLSLNDSLNTVLFSLSHLLLRFPILENQNNIKNTSLYSPTNR